MKISSHRDCTCTSIIDHTRSTLIQCRYILSRCTTCSLLAGVISVSELLCLHGGNYHDNAGHYQPEGVSACSEELRGPTNSHFPQPLANFQNLTTPHDPNPAPLLISCPPSSLQQWNNAPYDPAATNRFQVGQQLWFSTYMYIALFGVYCWSWNFCQ